MTNDYSEKMENWPFIIRFKSILGLYVYQQVDPHISCQVMISLWTDHENQINIEANFSFKLLQLMLDKQLYFFLIISWTSACRKNHKPNPVIIWKVKNINRM